jgi:hypothetical protein
MSDTVREESNRYGDFCPYRATDSTPPFKVKRKVPVPKNAATIHNIKPGDHITEKHWSDADTFTVLEINKRFVLAQADSRKLDPSFKPHFVPGGFAGHCTNNYEQKWVIESNPKGAINKFSVGRDGTLRTKGNRKPNVILGAHPFYDYNF